MHAHAGAEVAEHVEDGQVALIGAQVETGHRDRHGAQGPGAQPEGGVGPVPLHRHGARAAVRASGGYGEDRASLAGLAAVRLAAERGPRARRPRRRRCAGRPGSCRCRGATPRRREAARIPPRAAGAVPTTGPSRTATRRCRAGRRRRPPAGPRRPGATFPQAQWCSRAPSGACGRGSSGLSGRRPAPRNRCGPPSAQATGSMNRSVEPDSPQLSHGARPWVAPLPWGMGVTLTMSPSRSTEAPSARRQSQVASMSWDAWSHRPRAWGRRPGPRRSSRRWAADFEEIAATEPARWPGSTTAVAGCVPSRTRDSAGEAAGFSPSA